MLLELFIKDFIIIDHLHLDFNTNMTVITGETGAGKSIIIDALNIISGGKANANLIRPNCNKAEISACFNIDNNNKIKLFLSDNDLLDQDNYNSCIIRRIIAQTVTKSYINGKPVTLTQIKQAGEILLNLHNQHQHQTLLKEEQQRELLDNYADHKNLLEKVKINYTLYQNSLKKLSDLQLLQNKTDRLELINYQLQELNELNLQPGELITLEQQHERLTNSQDNILAANQIVTLLENTENIFSAKKICLDLQTQFPEIKPCVDMLSQTEVLLSETQADIMGIINNLEINPEQLSKIDDRITKIYNISRKHKIKPEQLLEFSDNLRQQANQYSQLENDLQEIESQILQNRNDYIIACETLSISRQKTAKILENKITKQIQKLAMPHGKLLITLTYDKNLISKSGYDKIDFLITTNPGQSPQALKKVASGGELSRISLAIEVIAANTQVMPCLIFDEVDVGISGKTAEIVGLLLKELSTKSQILCITHLAQVASQANHHLKVTKQQTKNTTRSNIIYLDRNDRVKEIARLLAGIEITKEALAHAENMLTY